MENKNLNRMARRVLYSMKRQYGNLIDMYKVVSSETDHLTGEITVVKQVTHVRRAILLPQRLKRDAGQTISVISSSKDFVYGGLYDLSARQIIIDPRDLADDFEITPSDYIAYKHERWDIVDVQKDEGLAGAWIIIAKKLPEKRVYEIFDIVVSSEMSLDESLDANPEVIQLKNKLNLSPSLHIVRYPRPGLISHQIELSQSISHNVVQ